MEACRLFSHLQTDADNRVALVEKNVWQHWPH